MVPKKQVWLDTIISEWQSRLPSSGKPFGDLTKNGTYSSWQLDGSPVSLTPGVDSLAAIKDILTSLTKAQGLQDVNLELGKRQNYSELRSRRMVIDAENYLKPKYGRDADPALGLDLLLGAVVHEWLHFELTDPYIAELVGRTQDPLLKAIWNVIEDEFIESNLNQIAPGWADLIWGMRHHHHRDGYAYTPDNMKHTMFAHFLLLVRYPKVLLENWEEAKAQTYELQEMTEILDPFPSTPQRVFDAAREIRTIFRDSNNHDDKSDDSLGYETDILPTSEKEDWIRTVSHRAIRNVAGRRGKILWQKMENERLNYTLDLESVRPQVAGLKKWLGDLFYGSYQNVAPALDSGSVDTHRLHRVYTDRQVFAQKSSPKPEKIDIALLCDQSASMEGEKILATRRVAIMFLEAMLPFQEFLELHIYGHTADAGRAVGSTTIYRYWGPTWRRRYSLGNMQAEANNADSEALLSVSRDLLQNAGEKLILVIISDANPHAEQHSGEPAVLALRSAVEKVESRGVTVIGVGIDPAVELDRIYNNFVNFTDLPSLPKQLGRLLRKVISN